MQMQRPAALEQKQGQVRKETDTRDVCACAADFQKSTLTPFCLHQFRTFSPLLI